MLRKYFQKLVDTADKNQNKTLDFSNVIGEELIGEFGPFDAFQNENEDDQSLLSGVIGVREKLYNQIENDNIY
jgi:hypothetical protein